MNQRGTTPTRTFEHNIHRMAGHRQQGPVRVGALRTPAEAPQPPPGGTAGRLVKAFGEIQGSGKSKGHSRQGLDG